MFAVSQSQFAFFQEQREALALEHGPVLIAQNGEQDFVAQLLLDWMPIDVEGGGVAGARTVLKHVPPPAVQRLADPHVVGHDIDDQAHVVGMERGDERLELLLCAQFRIEQKRIDRVIAVVAPGHGLDDGGHVAVGDTEAVQIRHDVAGMGKGEGAV